jgi:AcrR family transcriptional regulator
LIEDSEIISKEASLILQIKELIFRFGVKSLTMDDIAQKLTISKKTLYQHFENKQDLVDKVVNISLEHVKLRCANTVMEGNAIERMGKMYEIQIQIKKHINPALDFELKKYYPEAYKRLNEFHKEFIYNMMVENVNQGIKEGLYRAELHPEMIAYLFRTISLSMIDIEDFPNDKFSSPHLFVEFLIYHLRGICSEKGLTELNRIIKLFNISIE